MKRWHVLCVVLALWCGHAKESQALLVPSVLLGGQAFLFPEAGALPGARGACLDIELGWMWEWPKHNVAIGLFLPLETDFGTRFAVGPRFMFEAAGVFRLFVAPMVDIGPPFSLFFLRWGLAFGWRNTGQRPKPDGLPGEAGVYLWAALDYRIPTGGATLPGIPQELRMVWGLRIELGYQLGNKD